MSGGIFVLEDDADLCRVMVDLIRRTTHRECFGLGTFDEMRRERASVLRASLAILDVNLGAGQPSGLDAFAWLRAERFAGKVAFLTGHAASHPLVLRASEMGEALVLKKPLDAAQLLEIVP